MALDRNSGVKYYVVRLGLFFMNWDFAFRHSAQSKIGSKQLSHEQYLSVSGFAAKICA